MTSKSVKEPSFASVAVFAKAASSAEAFCEKSWVHVLGAKVLLPCPPPISYAPARTLHFLMLSGVRQGCSPITALSFSSLPARY